MERAVRISAAARRLGVTPTYLRALEAQGCIPPARRDYNGRVYSELDIALLRAMGVGSRPRRIKSAEEMFETGEPRVVYRPREDATPGAELKALVSIYGFLLDRCRAQKAGGPTTAPKDDVKESSDVWVVITITFR